MEKYFKIIEYKGKVYIFNTFTFETMKIDDAHELLLYENGEVPFFELSDKWKLFLEEGRFVRRSKLKIHEEQKNFDMISFSFPPIHKCNLRCDYCFANHGENYTGEEKVFSDVLVEQLCNFIIDNYPMTKQFRLDFVSGGEPLLDTDKTIHFIILAQKIFRRRGKKLFVWLCTNGTTITESNAASLDKLGVRLGVSIDGDRQVHNAVRPFADGMGSYDVIIKKIGRIFKDDNLSKQFKNIWALTTITSVNHDFKSILLLLKKLGFSGIQMKFIRVPKDNPLSLNSKNIIEYEKDIEEYFSFLFGECVNDNFSPLMLIANDTDFVGKIIKRYFLNMPLSNRCYAARNQFSITAAGDVFPCASFVGLEDYCIGNVFCGFDREKRNHFFNRTVDQNESCSVCWARYLCTGQCFSNCLLANGDIGVPEELYCRIEKKIIMETIFYATSLSDEIANKIVRLMKLKNYTND